MTNEDRYFTRPRTNSELGLGTGSKAGSGAAGPGSSGGRTGVRSLGPFSRETGRIFTDGRDWPRQIEPSYAGYSIGKWIDENGDGDYDVLEAETRGFKGPRVYDASGLPLHFDNQSIFKERIYRDKADPKIIHDEVTVNDHALTRPWTVDKRYVHNANPHPDWRESGCVEGSHLVALGKEMYILRADGLLMPTKKDQPAPDLRYFKQTRQ